MASNINMDFPPSFWGFTTITEHIHFGNPATATMSPGTIYYLPPFPKISRSKLTPTMHRDLYSVPDGVFAHPVLILSTNPQRSEATILIITSAGGRPFQDLHPRLQHYGVPIWPNEPHPLNNSLVCLKNEWGMPKECYADTFRQYTVPASILKPLFDQKNGHHFQLRDESFAFIASSDRDRSRPSSSSSGSNPLLSPTSSISSLNSIYSDSRSGTLNLRPSFSPVAPRPLVRYSVKELLALRPGSNLPANIIPNLRTPDFNLLSPSYKWRVQHKASSDSISSSTSSVFSAASSVFSASSSPPPSPSPPKRPLSSTISPSSSTPSLAWRSTSSSSVSTTPPDQHQYLDAQHLDSFFPSPAIHPPPHQQSPSTYIDAQELDAFFPTPAPAQKRPLAPYVLDPRSQHPYIQCHSSLFRGIDCYTLVTSITVRTPLYDSGT
ncbi:MAG: hypothetical protein Q9221_002163 [Calogaya cf. arnoldii]